jgi:hypothetical protein
MQLLMLPMRDSGEWIFLYRPLPRKSGAAKDGALTFPEGET